MHMNLKNKRLGEMLVSAKLLTDNQLAQALQDQKMNGGRLGSVLVRLGFINDDDLINFLCVQYGVPAVNLRDFKIDEQVASLIPTDVINKYLTIPINRVGSTLIVATCDPSNISAIDDIKFITGYNVEIVVAPETVIKETIEKLYDSTSVLEDVMSTFDDAEMELIQEEDEVSVGELKRETEDAPVIRLVNLILVDAIRKGASDIHLEPYEKLFRVRYRIDGVLHEVMKPPMKLKNAIISRLKIMSELDIAERRLPQDGRIKMKIGKGKTMDFRVSVLPTLFGEKIVLRLLDQSNLQLDMTKLGFEETPLAQVKDAIYRPYGMVLVTGPTGSGKTTTLYSALSDLNKISDNIMTAEDPVEFNLQGINQVQIREKIGLTFAAALRSFLRQDPDIILVGEMRDLETAEISIKAALTGHLVLSTLHTNDAPSTVTRLINMGVEPFLIVSSLNLIMAQRLARQICQNCREPEEIPVKALIQAGIPEAKAAETVCFKGKGCGNCNNTGYKGRIALYEVMPMTDGLKTAVIEGANTIELKQMAIENGMKSLRQSGLSKMIEGVTSFQEVLRVTAKD
ncbi:MAG: type IV-A pilus assembly ATPase PilB [Deltaproteobacteria bacterium]|nr:type IV-A pilus assembly ATPase PilB [Candidatus Anaeroferrophillus wilburensis]MBN2888783.1 type IV-A pilus assembly ATPase PilB [Deltaproteobacteria bacterium]